MARGKRKQVAKEEKVVEEVEKVEPAEVASDTDKKEEQTVVEEKPVEVVEEEKKASAPTGEFSKHLSTAEEKNEETAPVSKTNAVVAVSNGEGIDALFRELGADQTVSGGQTNNPSAQDFIDAFEKINPRVFPSSK